MNMNVFKCRYEGIYKCIYSRLYIYVHKHISYRGKAASKVDKTVERIRSMEVGMYMYMNCECMYAYKYRNICTYI
jgi:hypothetical protein